MKSSDILLATLHAQLNQTQDKIDWINQNKEKLDILDPNEYPISLIGNGIDFDGLSHEKVIEVIKLFTGKWVKEPAGTRIHYVLKQGDFQLRCYAGEPPPNCKIVEVEEVIPAQPERIEKRLKLICESLTAQAANVM